MTGLRSLLVIACLSIHLRLWRRVTCDIRTLLETHPPPQQQPAHVLHCLLHWQERSSHDNGAVGTYPSLAQ